MKINTNELRKFLSVSSNIQQNPLAQHLDLLIESNEKEVVFTKTNQNIWCRYSYAHEGNTSEACMVNEKKLNGILATCKEYEIEIEKTKSGKLQIVSGEGTATVIQQDMRLFPKMLLFAGQKNKIDKEVIKRIKVASRHISTGLVKSAFSFVNIGKGGVFAFNTMIAYYHNTPDLPDAFFDETPLAVIDSEEDVLYWASDNYDFFETNSFTFAFIKHAVKPVDWLPIVQQTSDHYFEFSKKDFLDFFTVVQHSKDEKIAEATFTQQGDDVLLLSYVDQGNDIQWPIKMTTNFKIDPFKFNVDSVERSLKYIPYQELRLHKLAAGHYMISTPEDEGYRGIIARLQEAVAK